MYRKLNDNEYNFVVNKINYTVEVMPNSIEVYESDNPGKTGFVFDGGLKQFIMFINTITDVAENIGEEAK